MIVTRFQGKARGGTFRGTYTTKGSDDLKGLRGSGTFKGSDTTLKGPYTGKVQRP